MTLQPSTLAFAAGVLALTFALINLGGAREAIVRPSLPNVAIAAESIRRFMIPNAFVPMFFGVLSVVFTNDLIETRLGIALCGVMGIYFGLRGWAYATSPEIRAAGSYFGTYVLLVAAGCYAAAAIWGSVI